MSIFTFGKARYLSDELHQVRADQLTVGDKLLWHTHFGHTRAGEIVNVRIKGSNVVVVVHTRDQARREQMNFEKFSFIRDTFVTLKPNATIAPSERIEIPVTGTYTRQS